MTEGTEIVLHLSLNKPINESKEGVCHVLPCSIDYSGHTATASKYFQVTEEQVTSTEDKKIDVNGSKLENLPNAKRDSTLVFSQESISNDNISPSTTSTFVEEDTPNIITSESIKDKPKKPAGYQQTYFRGRKLKGISSPLPTGLIGKIEFYKINKELWGYKKHKVKYLTYNLCFITGILLEEGKTTCESTGNTGSLTLGRGSDSMQNDHYDEIDEYDDNDLYGESSNREEGQKTKSVKAWSQIATFQNMTVWGHEKLPNPETDQYLTGVTDWVKLAHLVCSKKKNFFFQFVIFTYFIILTDIIF